MKGKSIVFKLFFITSALFMVFLIIIMGFQRIFFDEIYLKTKVSTTEKNIGKFADDYLQGGWSKKQTINKINEFTEKNNVPIVIMNEAGEPKYLNEHEPYNITIHTQDNLFFKVYLDAVMFNEGFQGFEPKLGDEIYVEGIYLGEDDIYIEPYLIEKGDMSYSFDDEGGVQNIDMGDYTGEIPIKSINGKIVYINNSSIDDAFYFDNRVNNLIGEIYSYIDGIYLKEEILSEEKIATNSYVNSDTGVKSIIFKKLINKSDGSIETIFAMTSLQPIGEAVDVMMQYYIYLFLLAVVFIILISFIYSKIIAEPLLEMDSVAKKMAQLDFSVSSKVKSKDEIGSLSTSLNILSSNLNKSMTELKEANEKLLDDIEKERIQDKIRKEFVASVSHELKTPLGIMKGFAEGIKDGIYEKKGIII